MKGILANRHWILVVLIWVSIAMVLTICAMGIVSLFPNQGSVAAMKWMQFLETVSMFLLPSLAIAYLYSDQPMRWLRLTPPARVRRPAALYAFAVLTMLVAIPGINLLSYLNQQLTLPDFLAPLETVMRRMEETAESLMALFLKTDSPWDLVINIALMALLPAVAEELTFRGLLVAPFLPQSSIKTYQSKIAIWAAAVIFSAIHFQFYGFVPRMLLGALFGYVLLWSQSLFVPMVMHFTNNCIAVLLYYIAYARGLNPSDLDALGTGDTLWVGILSLLLLIPAIITLRKICLYNVESLDSQT